jgi:hypothetical protein
VKILVAFAATGIAVVVVSPALAAPPSPVPPGIAAVSEYREMIPTAQGSIPARAPQNGRSANLTPSTEQQLHSVAPRDGKLLKQMATSAMLGAPAKQPRVHRHTGNAQSVAALPEAPVLTAAVAGTLHGGRGFLVFLLVMLAAPVAVAVARRRGPRDRESA